MMILIGIEVAVLEPEEVVGVGVYSNSGWKTNSLVVPLKVKSLNKIPPSVKLT